MSTHEDSDMNAEDSDMSATEDSESSTSEYSEQSSYEDSEVKCFCGLPAKLRVSHTDRNPYRLFYNCPKSYNAQCGFFHWSDESAETGDRHIDELNLIRDECIRLQGRLDNDRSEWEREKSELMSKLNAVQSELKDIKNRIKTVNDSDLMPPFDKSLSVDDDGDDAIVIHTI
ncbi:hypothetical protein JCGZ_16267 [Jatropha curcas]|uniref:GRF-type domain-containing protein n=2 Tax=Jatropha curcas TaxID=180498 RepID=A0A067LJH2_JATCU|nr:hypothetical protein JCGZ_16267 [Jatropha curcas]